MLVGLLRLLQKMPVRGKTRLTFLLARRLESLQSVPIQIADWMPIYMDLRRYDAHVWFAGSPWASSPREIGEQTVMRAVVRSGDVVYDIGANIGLHTALLARAASPAGRVFAFEPNPQLLPLLRRTIGGMPNAQLFECALSDSRDQMELYIPAEDHSVASLADWTHGKAGATITARVEVCCLDDLHLPAPDFIKCDIEGAELFAFRGARSLLDREQAPIILFEANVHTATGFGLSVSAARDFLAGLPAPRYAFYEVGEAGEIAPVTELNAIHSNVLAVPAARIDRLRPLRLEAHHHA